MSAVLDNRAALLPGRFEFLMGLYAETYHRLTHLFAPQQLAPGRYRSSVDDGHTGHPTPSAQLRMYTVAHVAEALHCHPGRHLWQVLGPFPEAHTVLQHRLRMNGFLSRWLEYLAAQV